MTIQEVKEAADMAETYPNSGELNFREIGWSTLERWVKHQEDEGDSAIRFFDIHSITMLFEKWWKKTRW
jgi:hypothetical protein